MNNPILLSTACWPSFGYMKTLVQAGHVVIEQFDSFGKHHSKNRYKILTANGPLLLTVPVHRSNHTVTRQVKISYTENWQQKHWRAITSAYRRSPYFAYLENEIAPLYQEKTELLLDYNIMQLQLLKKVLRLNFSFSLSDSYIKETGMNDQRENIPSSVQEQPYYQTFGDRYGFVPGLSILDMLFNTGPRIVDQALLSD